MSCDDNLTFLWLQGFATKPLTCLTCWGYILLKCEWIHEIFGTLLDKKYGHNPSKWGGIWFTGCGEIGKKTQKWQTLKWFCGKLYVELLHPGTYTGHNMVNKRDLHALMTVCSTCVSADKHCEAKGQPGFPFLHMCYDSYLSYLAKYQSLQAETLHPWRVLQLLYICNTARARYKILDELLSPQGHVTHWAIENVVP